MERQFNLIKTDYKTVEKRILPRFPFSYLIFRDKGQKFEIKDISYTGMQLCLKDGGHQYVVNDKIAGEIYWRGSILPISGVVKWAKGRRLGLRFEQDGNGRRALQEFLSVDNILAGNIFCS